MANCFYVMARLQHLQKPGKRHALRGHMPETATDWLNPLSLRNMSASAYIENLA